MKKQQNNKTVSSDKETKKKTISSVGKKVKSKVSQKISGFDNMIKKVDSWLCVLIVKINALLPLLLFTNNIAFIKRNKYTRLMRLDKLAGVWLVLLPALWSLTLGAHSPVITISFYIIFILAATLIRGAGCIINDLFDQKFDKKVERTKNRPLASGEVTKFEALSLLTFLLLLSMIILLALPVKAVKAGIIAIVLIAIYPLTKRFMKAPQIFLGITFNIGVIIGWFAVNPTLSLIPIFLYMASIFWTIGYDTIYALQDKAYDEKLGISSTAVLFQEKTKDFVWKVYKIYAILLTILGIYLHMNILFYCIIGVAAYHLHWQARGLDTQKDSDFLHKFQSNTVQGLLVLLALALGSM